MCRSIVRPVGWSSRIYMYPSWGGSPSPSVPGLASVISISRLLRCGYCAIYIYSRFGFGFIPSSHHAQTIQIIYSSSRYITYYSRSSSRSFTMKPPATTTTTTTTASSERSSVVCLDWFEKVVSHLISSCRCRHWTIPVSCLLSTLWMNIAYFISHSLLLCCCLLMKCRR